MSSAVNRFVHAVHKCSQKVPHAKWDIEVRLDRFLWFNHHSAALVLLCEMSLEQNFSIEQFQSNAISKIRKSQHNHVVFLYVFSCAWSVWRLLLKIPSRWVLFVSHQGFTATSSFRLNLKSFGTVRVHGHAYQFQYTDYETHTETRIGLTCR